MLGAITDRNAMQRRCSVPEQFGTGAAEKWGAASRKLERGFVRQAGSLRLAA